MPADLADLILSYSQADLEFAFTQQNASRSGGPDSLLLALTLGDPVRVHALPRVVTDDSPHSSWKDLAMRTVYVIAYDVADPKRLRKVFQMMKGAGTALQYSIFRCELSPLEKQILKEQLWELLNFAEDRVLLANLGPIEGRGDTSLELWGAPRETDSPRDSVII